MTRINLVKVEDLADQHLFAEWREIKMIPAKVKKLLETKTTLEISKAAPMKYTLNEVNVMFFYNKFRFLYERFNRLTDELYNRNFNLSEANADEIFINTIPMYLRQTWEPTIPEIKINVDRIVERLNERPVWYRYYGEIKSPEFFIERYRQQLVVDTLATI